MLIPKIICQIWLGSKEPPWGVMESWKRLNPDYEYRLIRNETGWGEYQPLLDDMHELNGKSDIIREIALAGGNKFGGIDSGCVYADCDVEATKPLEESWRSCESWASWENEISAPPLWIASSVMGGRPGGSFFTDVVSHLAKCDMRKPAVTEIGPGLISRVAESHPELRVLPGRTWGPYHYQRTLAPGSSPVYGIHYWAGTHGVERDADGRWLDPPKWQQAPEPEVFAGRRPTVSVIIPCLKQAKYLAEAVASVHAQTVDDWEIVIVASDNESEQEAHFLAALAKKIRVIRIEPRGLGDARNVGISAAHGHYILPLDADDTIDPMFLEKTLARMRGDKYEIVNTYVREFGDACGMWQCSPFENIREANAMCCCSLFTRALWEDVGGYDECIGHEDWDLWLKASERNPTVSNVPEYLFNYRVHGESMIRWDNRIGARRFHEAMMRLRHPSMYDESRLERDRATLSQMPSEMVEKLYERARLFPGNNALRVFVKMARANLPAVPVHPAPESTCGCIQCKAEREALAAMRRR